MLLSRKPGLSWWHCHLGIQEPAGCFPRSPPVTAALERGQKSLSRKGRFLSVFFPSFFPSFLAFVWSAMTYNQESIFCLYTLCGSPPEAWGKLTTFQWSINLETGLLKALCFQVLETLVGCLGRCMNQGPCLQVTGSPSQINCVKKKYLLAHLPGLWLTSGTAGCKGSNATRGLSLSVSHFCLFLFLLAPPSLFLVT